MNRLAHALSGQGRHAEAEKLHRQVFDVCMRILGPDHPDTLASITNLATELELQGRHQDAEAAWRQTIALSHRESAGLAPLHVEATKGNAYVRFGRLHGASSWHKEVETALRETTAHMEKLAAEFSQEPAYQLSLADAYRNLALSLSGAERYAEREHLYGNATKILTRLVQDNPNASRYRDTLTDTLCQLGDVLTVQRRSAEAEQAYRQAISLCEKLASDFPTRPEYRRRLGNIYQWSLDQLFHATGRPQRRKRLGGKPSRSGRSSLPIFPRRRRTGRIWGWLICGWGIPTREWFA